MELRLLIVEDDCLLAEAAADYFTGKGWRVETAEDGVKALELLRRKSYHLILLDVMLPGMDGFAVCRKIRKYSDIPVILGSGRLCDEALLPAGLICQGDGADGKSAGDQQFCRAGRS